MKTAVFLHSVKTRLFNQTLIVNFLIIYKSDKVLFHLISSFTSYLDTQIGNFNIALIHQNDPGIILSRFWFHLENPIFNFAPFFLDSGAHQNLLPGADVSQLDDAVLDSDVPEGGGAVVDLVMASFQKVLVTLSARSTWPLTVVPDAAVVWM